MLILLFLRSIIFISALSLPNEIDAGFAAGSGDYISKPFKEEAIIDKVEYL